MSKLMVFGVCCLGISVWGLIQLTILGILYKVEAITLLEDAEAEEYADPVEFIQKTKKNYVKLARNCWMCAVLYVVMIAVCIVCIKKAQKKEKLAKAKLADDDQMCIPQEIDDGIIVDADLPQSERVSIKLDNIKLNKLD